MKIAGVDEVGMGAIAGPIVAVAALYDDLSCPFPGLIETRKSQLGKFPFRDSKSFSPEKRTLLYDSLIDGAISVGLGHATHEEILLHGLPTAHTRCLQRAVEDLQERPDILFIDGARMKLSKIDIPQKAEDKMDCLHWQVAAASIIAKVWRDSLMREYHLKYPAYSFFSNCGYGTDVHCAALQKLGPCPIHRTEFIQKILNRDPEPPRRARRLP